MRAIVAASGAPGHVLPAAALARALGDRGADVCFATGEPWRGIAEAAGLEWEPIDEYSFLGFPPAAADQTDVAAVACSLAERFQERGPDLVVSDVFTVASALAAELACVPRATLVPYTYPVGHPGLPFFTGMPVDPVGLLPPRTSLGTAAWRRARSLHERRLEWERRELDAFRAKLDLPPNRKPLGATTEPTLVATLPQLEYPRPWPVHVHVTGPMVFEVPHPPVELPPGDGPLVLVASSTLHDRDALLVRTALDALADEPVRVLAALNQKGREWDGPVPANARVVDWVSYAQVMPKAAAVICHGGHGTIVRALVDGAPVLVCPAWGDQADNGARVTWSELGLLVPRRLQRPRPLRWALRALLGDSRYAARAGQVAAWHRAHDGAGAGATLLERYVAECSPSSGTEAR